MLALLVAFAGASSALAQETVCARVKIEIKQKLTLERQAFDAEMRINNTTETGTIENVGIEVKVTDEFGAPVRITENPNDLTAALFIRVSRREGIDRIDGSGTITPTTTATINWLIIPSPGAAGTAPEGKKYLIGATLKYRFRGEDTTLDVTPDVVTVRPMPLLTLDYFLPREVTADDPITPEIEPVEPFTLGVRVKNNGNGLARNLKIESAQPRIIENLQGLLIGFRITGSHVDDRPVANSLLIDFGDIESKKSRMGRWVMETTLSGRFTEFTARFTHADEFGGALTSLLQATNAHTLVRDVRVDLPGRDLVRDFLGDRSGTLMVYESSGEDTAVLNVSGSAQLTGSAPGDYQLAFPSTPGFVYLKLADPFAGQKALGAVMRSDGKRMLPENVWLTRARNATTKQLEYFFHLFDANSTGAYRTEFVEPGPSGLPPQIQFIPDRRVSEGKQVAFLVEASSPGGLPVTLSAAPLPGGATFVAEPPDPNAPRVARAVFDWTPAIGQAGNYIVVYTASDGQQQATRSARIVVDPAGVAVGPGTPEISAPLSGAEVDVLRPLLSVLPGGGTTDPAKSFEFELYRDEAMTQRVERALVPRVPDNAPGNVLPVIQPTTWSPTAPLNDNTRYWWRVRAFDGVETYSPWAEARFFVNLFNDPPDRFNLLLPWPNTRLPDGQPLLSWQNANDRDGDTVTYGVRVYRDGLLTDLVASVDNLAGGANGSTEWRVTPALPLQQRYWWRVVARDSRGAETLSPVRALFVGDSNSAPSAPGIVRPLAGATVTTSKPSLVALNSTDPEGDRLTYRFEIDTRPSFDSPDLRVSTELPTNSGAALGSANTAWTPSFLLVENQRYWWRARASDGRLASAWSVSDFLFSRTGEPPPPPTPRNPGAGAWVATTQPTLEAHPVKDPEGDAVSYQFEVYADAAGTSRVASGESLRAWMVPTALANRSTHWWRVRAVDAGGLASAWSPLAAMHIRLGPDQEPRIQLTQPAAPIAPGLVNGRRIVRIEWAASDPNTDSTIALYASPVAGQFAGQLIVDGLRQPAGTHAGHFDWDVTALPVGTQHVYAVIYNARSYGRAFAAGAVVVPAEAQAGRLVVSAPAELSTSEGGKGDSFTVALASAPRGRVVVPVASSLPQAGLVDPAKLEFDETNWSVPQRVKVLGQAECGSSESGKSSGERRYSVVLGRAISLDPDYMGVGGMAIPALNVESGIKPLSLPGPAGLVLCGLRWLRSTQVAPASWQHEFAVTVLAQRGTANGVVLRLSGANPALRIVEREVMFGALSAGIPTVGVATVLVTSSSALTPEFLRDSNDFVWQVTQR